MNAVMAMSVLKHFLSFWLELSLLRKEAIVDLLGLPPFGYNGVGGEKI